MEIFLLIVSVIILLLLSQMIKIVPQQQAWVLEKLGKFDKVLEPGMSVIIPVIQRVAYKHTLKEEVVDILAQTAISQDNVTLSIDGILYIKIVDAVAASYGVNNPYYAISQLAQTTMRSEIGKMKLDRTFEERDSLNLSIVSSINEAATNWGIQCMRYEIKDIQPPVSILNAMELQVAAERQKRANILESEGARQSQINISEGQKAQVVLESEGSYIDQVNRAKGEAEAVLCVAQATAKSIDVIAASISKQGGSNAVSLKIAEQYVQAFSKLARENNTVILPASLNDPSSFIAQALSIYDNLNKKRDI